MDTTTDNTTTNTLTNTTGAANPPAADNKPGTSGGNSGQNGPEEHPQLIESVQGKLGPFWPNNPDTWFKIAEVQFYSFKITSDRVKLGMTLTALQHFPDVLGKVLDVIERLPEYNKYNALKTALISRLSSSKQQRLEELLEKVDLGDKRPSEVLRHMRSLATGDLMVSEDIIRTLWLRRLPQTVNIPLISVGDKPMDELAEMADKIYEAIKLSYGSVCTTAHQPISTQYSHQQYNVGASTSQTSALEARMARIESMLANLSTNNAGSGRSRQRSNNYYRNRSNSRRRSGSRSSSRNNDQGSRLCYFHRKFGTNAYTCRKPCSFNSNKPDSANNNYQPNSGN